MSAPRAVPSALAVSSDGEKAAVLDELVAADHELKDRAERAARARLAQVDTDDVTNAVVAALLALDQEDLAARAGRTRYGYVDRLRRHGHCSKRLSSRGLRTSPGGRASGLPRPRAVSGSGPSRRSSPSTGTFATTTCWSPGHPTSPTRLRIASSSCSATWAFELTDVERADPSDET
jgi:hypothetical protein